MCQLSRIAFDKLCIASEGLNFIFTTPARKYAAHHKCYKLGYFVLHHTMSVVIVVEFRVGKG